MLINLLGAAFLMFLPLALGGGCLWVAFKLVGEAKKQPPPANYHSQLLPRAGCYYVLAAFLAFFGVTALLMDAILWYVVLTWRGFYEAAFGSN